MRRLLLALPILVAGCAIGPTSSPEANRITLQQAMVSTVDAIEAANKEAAKAGYLPGFQPCSLTAVFSINDAGTVTNQLTLGAGGTVSGATLGAQGHGEVGNNHTVGNQVTLVLVSKDCAPAERLPTKTATPTAPTK